MGIRTVEYLEASEPNVNFSFLIVGQYGHLMGDMGIFAIKNINRTLQKTVRRLNYSAILHLQITTPRYLRYCKDIGSLLI